MKETFYFCNSCGNLMIAAIASGLVPFCCGKEMSLLEPNTTDADNEKHLPVINYTSRHSMNVTVGSKPHPMTQEHSIRFICLETNVGCIIHYLDPGALPEADFCYNGEPVAVYAYCNLHGLWRVDAPKRNAGCGMKAVHVM